MKRIQFQLILAFSTSIVVFLGFVAFTLLTQKYIYEELVGQALKDNKVIGESVLNLLSKTQENDSSKAFIPILQNTCDIMELPNGGFICAAEASGKLVASPGLKLPSEENVNGGIFSDISRSVTNSFLSLDKSKSFETFYEYPADGYSDIVVGIPHKSGLTILVHQNNTQIQKQASKHSTSLILLGVVFAAFIGLITYFATQKIVKTYRNTIGAQNIQLREAFAKIGETNTEINRQRKKITDSIRYAQRIQQASMPPEAEFLSFFSDHFLLFNPKDIVSGDFYWIHKVSETEMIVVAADCTGHGVPGAFMSIIGRELLNNIVIEKKITMPNEILTTLSLKIKESLRQDATDNRDGMDLIVCNINLKKKQMYYAGAMNPLYYVQENKFFEIKADKKNIGGRELLAKEFTLHTIDLQKETTIYLCSDGYQDQFNVSTGRKFMVKNLIGLLYEISGNPLGTQKELLNSTLATWQMEAEQVDDIMIIGLKI